MVKEVNLNLIRTFCLIYEHQGISRAADELHLSQPTVSYSLKQLRKAFSDQLFYRERGLLHPTPRAQQVYPDLRAALDLIATTEISSTEFGPDNSTREFVLMLSDLGEVVFLPSIQQLFEAKAPAARLRIEPLDVVKVPEKLTSGEIDAAIQTPRFYSDDVERTVIYRDIYVVIASVDHPRIQGSISLEQMSAERFIRIKSSIGHDAPENLLLEAGMQLHTGIIGTRVVSTPGVVMSSELLGIIPTAVIESLGWSDRIQILPNPINAEPMEVSLMSRVKQRRTRPQKWFVNLIEEAVGNMPSDVDGTAGPAPAAG
ncbi:HTH-type transcriptional regulator LeuO (plasmid) [Corynebacterium occultum]|uniref:HTH-type transcriptional regulator LeuO n=1 Tax=Corynebacterium occultum TaxID=2675219 RepID=A0A6B8VTF4_9CORY|nr:LysR family transcriptional regulator [Corynebacterium occultum]QGU08792.1 HTH-type transcriptional regulator LeuO [Corynebacterium occultum]